MSSKPYLTRGPVGVIEGVAPDENGKMGGSGTAVATIPLADSVESLAAPFEGRVIIYIPDGTVATVRIGKGAVATATDAQYPAGVYMMPIREGERVSLWGISGGADGTVCMAR